MVDTQWNINADLFKAALDDNPKRTSVTVVFPRILELFGNVKGSRLLDYGCGAGRFCRAFHDRGAVVTGYDFSPRQLELAVEDDGSRGVFFTSDLLEIPDNRFDYALCFCVLVCNPLKEAARVVQDVHSRLKRHGVAIFVNTNTAAVGRTFNGNFTKMPDSQTAGAPYLRHYSTSAGEFDVIDHWYSPSDLKDLYERAGFTLNHQEIIEDYFVLDLVEK